MFIDASSVFLFIDRPLLPAQIKVSMPPQSNADIAKSILIDFYLASLDILPQDYFCFRLMSDCHALSFVSRVPPRALMDAVCHFRFRSSFADALAAEEEYR